MLTSGALLAGDCLRPENPHAAGVRQAHCGVVGGGADAKPRSAFFLIQKIVHRTLRCAEFGPISRLETTTHTVGLESSGLRGVLGYLTSIGYVEGCWFDTRSPHRAPRTVLEVGTVEPCVSGGFRRQVLHAGSDGRANANVPSKSSENLFVGAVSYFEACTR